MRTILIVVLGLVGFVIVGYLFLVWRTLRATSRRDRAVEALVQPLVARISNSEDVEATEIAAVARNPLTRNRLYDALESIGRIDLFPREYSTPEALAESDLTYWLAHAHELGHAPDEIVLAEKLRRAGPDGDTADYYVFKFRTLPPHWAAANGWLAGIAGPYKPGKSMTMARATFSRLEPFDKCTASEHLHACLRAPASPTVTDA
jgi:hypothetical protein